VHVARAAQVADYASEVPDFAAKLVAAFWPGPLTLILPRRAGVAAAAAGGQKSIGLRCPAHPVALVLLQACGTGLAGPSANRFGRVSPTTALHVQEELGEDLLVLDGGPCAVGIESTIVDCTRGQPVLLRPGVLTCAQLEAACGQPVLDKDTPVKTSVKTQAPRASGTLAAHYQPVTPVDLVDAVALEQHLAQRSDRGPVAVWSRERPARAVAHWAAAPARAADFEAALYDTLRRLDAMGMSGIVIEAPAQGPEWAAVHDRLARAAHR
jgi:L-threonylcarbamoyladenylate synthase